jgi:hypothetical protein
LVAGAVDCEDELLAVRMRLAEYKESGEAGLQNQGDKIPKPGPRSWLPESKRHRSGVRTTTTDRMHDYSWKNLYPHGTVGRTRPPRPGTVDAAARDARRLWRGAGDGFVESRPRMYRQHCLHPGLIARRRMARPML